MERNAELPSNVVFVVLDSARAITFYELLDDGYLPNLARLTERGTVYSNAVSNGPWTVPSHGSMFTGKYPADHGITGQQPRYGEGTYLPTLLGESGYDTAAFSANPWLSPEFGFDTLFDTYLSKWETDPDGADLSSQSMPSSITGGFSQLRSIFSDGAFTSTASNLAHALSHRFRSSDDGASHLLSSMSSWIAESATEPWFVFANLTEVHLDYTPPKSLTQPFLPEGASFEDATAVPQSPWEYVVGEIDLSEREFELLEALYCGEMRYLDGQIGELLDDIDASTGLEETTVVIAGDHGENIGEHELMDHQYSVHQTLLNVPLLVSPTPDPAKSSTLVEIRDLFPTILQAAGVEHSGAGVSEQTVFDGREHAFAEYVSPRPSLDELAKLTDELPPRVRGFDQPIRAVVRDDGLKLIEYHNDEDELYDLDSDPDELDCIRSERPDALSDLRETIHDERGEVAGAESDSFEPSGNISDRLESLGYI